MTTFKGTLTAIATPFDPKTEEIDYDSLDKLIQFQIDSGVDGIVACGSTAEAASLTDEEYKALLRYVANSCRGKIQCIGGVITNNTRRASEMGNFISTLKLDGLLLVTPPYIKPTQEGIIQHFRAVKASTNVPLIAYNIPGRSACLVLPETLSKLLDEGLIAAVKDSTGSLEHMMEVYSLCGDKLDILSGEDSLVFSIMSAGGKGVISACANVIPKEFVEITSTALSGDFKSSRDAQLKIQKVIRSLFAETNPIPVKNALYQKGIFKSDHVRVPLTRAKESTAAQIKSLLA